MSHDPSGLDETLIDQLLEDASSPRPTSRLLLTGEVAALFQVSERSVRGWAATGRLPSLRTPGGHHRFPGAAVLGLYESMNGEIES